MPCKEEEDVFNLGIFETIFARFTAPYLYNVEFASANNYIKYVYKKVEDPTSQQSPLVCLFGICLGKCF